MTISTSRLCRLTLTAALALGAFTLLPARDAGAVECGRHENVIKLLADRYSERRTAMGIMSNKGIMELWVSEGSGTWTMLLTLPNGVSCILAAGEAFEDLPSTASLDPAA
jgi:hypothetical protein